MAVLGPSFSLDTLVEVLIISIGTISGIILSTMLLVKLCLVVYHMQCRCSSVRDSLLLWLYVSHSQLYCFHDLFPSSTGSHFGSQLNRLCTCLLNFILYM